MPIMSKQLVILLIFLHTTLTLSLSVSAQGYYTYSATAYPPALWTNNQTLGATLYSENNQTLGASFTFICEQSQNCVLGVVYNYGVVYNFNSNYNYSYNNYSYSSLVVWCANRDHPVKENATLHFVQDGNLILHDADGSILWSTNTTGSSVVGMKLMGNWNLVLFDKNDVSIWESFDYPTDTWLPGQALKVGQQLTANSSAASLGTGQFFLNITSAAMEAYINSSPPQLYFRYQLSNKRVTTNVTFSSGRLVVEPNFALSPSESIALSKSGSSSPQFLRLDSDGHLRYYEIVDNEVNLLSDVFNYTGNLDSCAYPTVCGEYGICLDNNDCTCPDFTNFKPVDERQLNLGCLPLTPLSCQSTENHELLPLHNVTHFIYNVVLEEEDFDASIFLQNITVEQCKQACLGNCTCKAALFKFGEDPSDGYCYLTWQLYSLMNNNPETTGYNSSAYIKVETSANSSSSNSSKGSHRIRKEGVTIVGVVLGSLFIAVITISLIILLRKLYKMILLPNDLVG